MLSWFTFSWASRREPARATWNRSASKDEGGAPENTTRIHDNTMTKTYHIGIGLHAQTAAIAWAGPGGQLEYHNAGEAGVRMDYPKRDPKGQAQGRAAPDQHLLSHHQVHRTHPAQTGEVLRCRVHGTEGLLRGRADWR